MRQQTDLPGPHDAPQPSRAGLPFVAVGILCVTAAALQVAFLGPRVLAGGPLESIPVPGLPALAYRADPLSITFGIAWLLCLGLAALSIPGLPRFVPSGRLAFAILLLALASLQVAYARGLPGLWAGWEVAGLAVWLAFVENRRSRWWLLACLHTPGWLLLAVILSGPYLFAPAAGGASQVWPWPAALAFGAVCLARSGCWPFNSWLRAAAAANSPGRHALLGLYALSGPYLLARALVPAAWNAQGAWLLSLLGLLALVGAATSCLDSDRNVRGLSSLSAHSALAVIGLGMASAAPVAGLGALAAMLSGLLLLVASGANARWPRYAGAWLPLSGGFLAAWCIAQGAMRLHYGLVAAVLLPAGVLVGLGAAEPGAGRRLAAAPGLVAGALLLLAGIAPQAVVQWVVGPALGAMAGGVAPLRGMEISWGLGIQFGPVSQAPVAAFPATGAALAALLAFLALYWLSRLFKLFMRPEPEIRPEAARESLQIDDIMPGAGQAGRWLDLANLVALITRRGRAG